MSVETTREKYDFSGVAARILRQRLFCIQFMTNRTIRDLQMARIEMDGLAMVQ